MRDDITHDDEIVLIDYLTGRLDREEADALEARLESDDRLRQRRDTIARSFAALDLAPQPEAPDDLLADTLAHIAAAEKTERLLARQQIARPGGYWHTFNLRELAAIAAAIVLMIGVFVPSLRVARQRNHQNICTTQLGQIGAGLQTYAMNNAGFLPHGETTSNRWLPDGAEPVASNSAAPFKLVRLRYVAGPSVFQCPAVGGPGFTVREEMTDFPSPQHISYSYQHAVGGNVMRMDDPDIVHAADDMVILADQTPLFRNYRFMPDRLVAPISENHGGRGMAVLYIAGHVRWVDHAGVGVKGDNIFLADDLHEYTGTEAPAQPTDSFLLPSGVKP
jgi:hypothetical protein